jgi:hypothetical protein
MLAGLEFAVNSPMKVCPSVQDRCCSVTDEVTISKFWNDKTKPLLNTMTDKIVKNMWLTIQYYKNITLMDPQLIMVKHLIKRRIPLARRVCRTISRRVTPRIAQRIERYYHLVDRGEDLDLGSFDFVNTFQSRHPNDTLWNIHNQGEVNETVANPRFDPWLHEASVGYDINSFSKSPRELDDLSAQYNDGDPNAFPVPPEDDDLDRFLVGFEDPQADGQPSKQQVENLIKRMENITQMADEGRFPNFETNSSNPDHYDMYRFIPDPVPVQLPQTPAKPAPPARAPVIPNLDPVPGPEPPRRFPNQIDPKRPAIYQDIYHDSVRIDSLRKRPTSALGSGNIGWVDPQTGSVLRLDLLDPDQRAEFLRRNQSVGTMGDDEVLRWDIVQDHYNRTNHRTRTEKESYRIPNLSVLGVSIRVRAARCRSVRRSFIKEFVIINEDKVDFCFALYRRFLNFDIDLFEGFLPKVKDIIAKLSEHKKSFYCALCDGHKQQHFSIGNQMVYYAIDYCRTTLTEFKDFFRFMNLIYVDFVDSILQYIQCFESDGLVFEFPFQNFLGRMKQRYPFWRRCLDSLDSEFFINSCWSICNKLNLNVRSNLIEGNLEFMERSTATIYSFLRKVKIESAKFNVSASNWTENYSASFTMNLRTGANVDGLMIEPMGPATIITDNKFVIDQATGPLLVKTSNPSTNMTDQDVMQAGIDEMLDDLDLGTIHDLVDYGKKVIGFRRMGMPLNDTYLTNADRPVSRANGLINQLYKLRTIQQLSPNDIPSRFLKQETFKIIKKFGMRPKEYVRTLRLLKPPSARKLQMRQPKLTPTPTPFSAKEHWGVHSYGRPIRFNTTAKPPPIEETMPELLQQEVESNVEVYHKILNSTDVRNLGVMYEKEGINPLQDFEMANYGFNITKLIGLQFTKAEKIDSDVIKQFVACTAADINRFNENGRKHIMGLKDLELKYKDLKNAGQLDTLAKILAPEKNISLSLQVQTRFRNKMSQMMKIHSKNQALEAMEERMNQMWKLNAMMKSKEQQELKVNHHWFEYFHELFNGVADLFLSLFGS